MILSGARRCRTYRTCCRINNLIRANLKMEVSSRSGSSGIRSGKIFVNGVNLYYEQVGSGPMALLLIPGSLGSTQTDFKPQLEKLNRELFTVTAFDPRGYGKSRPPDRDYPVDYLKRDAHDGRELMKALGFNSYSVLGWSDGAVSALTLAGTFPMEVQKLIVIAGLSIITQRDLDIYEGYRDFSTWSDSILKHLHDMYGKENFERMWISALDINFELMKKTGGDINSKEVARIVCPTLIIHGELDPMIPLEHAQGLHKAIKGSRLLVWPKGKHNVHLKYQDEFNQVVEEFLTKETRVKL